MSLLNFYRISEPSPVLVPSEKQDKYYKSLRFQAFMTGTLGYALYYVCRLSMGVMKQPIIDAGLLNATQLGIIGTVVSGWLSDVVFGGDRKYPAFAAGILEALALALFLFGGDSKWVIVLSMVLFGVAIGVLISFLGGLMAIDLVPRKATGAALGIVGMASYAAAGLQNVVTGLLLDGNIIEKVNAAGETVQVHDFTYVSFFWLGAAIISFMLPVLNWKRKQQEI